ncbi:MAG TPA: GNAT family N-acetyltransferase [Anaerolineales bacterium]|nr:GNAT family N-acetyltransferase [Anaerolineales bacterium]
MTSIITPKEIEIPGAPRLEGLRFRTCAGLDDYEPMLAVYTACAEVDGLVERMTVADMANFVEHPIARDSVDDLVLAEVAGRIVGYAWVNHRREAGGDEVHGHRGYVHPAWRRRGIGTALAGFACERAFATPVAGDPDSPRLLRTFMLETEREGHALFRRLGYAPIRYAFNMVRDLTRPIPDLPLPAGLEIRPAVKADFRRIWEAEREAFQDAWGYFPWPEEAFQRFATYPHYDPDLWRVAWDGAEVAGGVLNFVNEEENAAFGRRRGYTEDIFVRRPWRRRGLASALIARSLQALRELRLDEAALAVDAESPTGALNLYTRMGYTTAQTWTTYALRLPSDKKEPR